VFAAQVAAIPGVAGAANKGEIMRGVRVVLLGVVAVAGLSLGTGVGASTENQTVAKGVGLHVRNVEAKGGAFAYVRLPDRYKRFLRAADVPAFSCPYATSKTNTATTQSCTWSPSYSGPVTCLQVSVSPNVTQTCDATQTNTTQGNNAVILQVIWSKNPSAAQDGTQIVRLRQTDVSGTNNAGIAQYIKQSKGPGTPDDTEDDNVEPDAPATLSAIQSQEGHQSVHLRQITGDPLNPSAAAGANNAAVLQFQRQRERASHAATVTQSQNTASRPTSCVPEATSDQLVGVVTVQADANQCMLTNQSSTNGAQNLLLNADYNQLQRARRATTGSQTQGLDSAGGGDIGLAQLSTGLSKILTNQNERLVQRAIDATGLLQDQNGPRKGSGSTQGTNPDDTWQGFQTSTLIQTSTTTATLFDRALASPGHQSDLLEYLGDSTGDIRAAQTANLNGDVTNWGCPQPGTTSTGPNHLCDARVQCEQGGIDLRRLQAVAAECTPTCPEGTFFNPDTQQCEPIVVIGAPAPVLYRRKA
jgi:hypothetical protein